jgi:hypothetical protein
VQTSPSNFESISDIESLYRIRKMVQEPSIMTMASDAGEWQQADSVYLQAVMFCLGWVMVRSIRLVASTLSRSTAGTAQVCNCGESFGHVTAVRSLTAPDLPVHEDSPPGSPVSAAPPSPPPPSTTSLALSVDGACATEPPSSVRKNPRRHWPS